MKPVKISLANGKSCFVEIIEASDDLESQAFKNSRIPKDSEKTDGYDEILELSSALEESLAAILETIHAAVSESKLNEMSVELNFGFRGKINPIPILLSGEASSSLKIIAKWIFKDR